MDSLDARTILKDKQELRLLKGMLEFVQKQSNELRESIAVLTDMIAAERAHRIEAEEKVRVMVSSLEQLHFHLENLHRDAWVLAKETNNQGG